MGLKRIAVEFGMGSALRSGDPTSAAVRAVENALWHNSLTVAQAFDKTPADMVIDVEIACPHPEKLDASKVISVFPYGQVSVSVNEGGLSIPKPEGGETLMAHAAIIVSLDLEGA